MTTLRWFVKFIALTLVSATALFLVGGMVGLIESWDKYLICLMPLLMGCVAGALAVCYRVVLGVPRILTALLGALFGLAVYVTYHYTAYLLITRTLGEDIPPFWDYMELSALVGFKTLKLLTVQNEGAYLFWASELLFIMIFAGWLGGQLTAKERQARREARKQAKQGDFSTRTGS